MIAVVPEPRRQALLEVACRRVQRAVGGGLVAAQHVTRFRGDMRVDVEGFEAARRRQPQSQLGWADRHEARVRIISSIGGADAGNRLVLVFVDLEYVIEARDGEDVL